MIVSERATKELGEAPQQVESHRHPSVQRKITKLHWKVWLCLLLACLGASWFSYQYFLVPQPESYTPNWQQARWIQAADGTTPVAYFRSVTNLNALPDGAFVTVAASQDFRLYVNGIFVGANAADLVGGNVSRSYIFDITSLLRVGANALGLRVANADQQTPSVRVSLGLVRGNLVSYQGSGENWQATAQSAAVHPRYADNPLVWATGNFDASAWSSARQATGVAGSPPLAVDPQIYEQPLPTHWISAGIGQEAYFVRQISLPSDTQHVWMRLIASGTASVFINGHLSMIWDSQITAPPQDLASYLSNTRAIVRSRAGFVLGIYNISPYLHSGTNTIAVHVQAPGKSTVQAGLDSLNTAMSLDMLISDSQQHGTWLEPDTGWHASPSFVDGWSQGSNAALAWQAPVSLGHPGANQAFYLPATATSRNVQFEPLSSIGLVVLFSSAVILGIWLLMSLVVMRRYYVSRRRALEATSLMYLPALAFEVLLVVLSREPQLPSPFPYTWFWGLLLILLVGVSYLLLWLATFASVGANFSLTPLPWGGPLPWRGRVTALGLWLRTHWGLVLIMLLAIPLICYNLPYEPYWQDELTSYFAAKGILAHGIPVMPSGFLYPKGELYSYLLALSIAIFGDQGGAPRMLTVVEYLGSLPLIYGVGCYFFNRRIALLATAMLAFSPLSLLWGRQMRMYEQAQFFTLLTVFLFYKALQEPKRVRLVYFAGGSLIATYLSHEETFIILPAIVVCVLVCKNAFDLLPRDGAGGHSAIPPWSRWRLPAVMYQKHWWYAAGLGATVIALQLLVVRLSHPPILGTDQSQRPLIQFTTDNVPYYIKLLFFPMALNNTTPWIMLNSLLAILGCIWAIRTKDARATFCALFLIISFLTLVLLFTLTTDRYIYPLLPIYYLLGAYALLMGLRAFWTFARSRIERRGQYTSLPLRILATLTLLLVCASVLILPMLPLSNYNLLVSRASGLAYHRHFPDYDAVGQYMQQHWHKGDVVITVSPAISILYYVGHVDYFFSVDRALYLFERDGHIIDTPTGSIALLSQDDLQAVVASHTRIWIISDNAEYQSEVTKNRRFIFPPDFRVVFEGYGSAVYLRGG